jgi:DNA-binding response OmpR family regulator
MSNELKLEVVSLSEVPPADGPEKRRPVVLIVDDEVVITKSLAAILSISGFAPLTAYDGESALELACAVPPDLLITDVVMPGMTGIELAIALVARVPDCRVLLFSGQAATIDLLAQAHTEGHDFTLLTKPIHPKDLLASISGCLQMPISVENPTQPVA